MQIMSFHSILVKRMKLLIGLFILFVSTLSNAEDNDHSSLTETELIEQLTPSSESMKYRIALFMLMQREQNFTAACFAKLFESEVKRVFFTLNPNGSFSEIVWIPHESTLECFDDFLRNAAVTDTEMLPQASVHMDLNLSSWPTISTAQ